jgi:PAS domain S-box-containing protein
VSDDAWKLTAFERLLAASPAHVAVVRLVGHDAVVELIGPRTAQLFGDHHGTLLGRRAGDLLPPPAADELLRQLEHARAVGDVRFESVRDRPDGRWTSNIDILPIGGDRFVLYARDVSPEREARRQLEHLEAVAGIGMYHWNAIDDDLVWSDQLYRLFGYEPGEVELTHELFYAHVHPDDRPEQERLTERARRSGETVTTSFRIVRADGQERTIEVHAEAVVADGRLLYAIGTMQDLTERRELEQHAEEARTAAARHRTGLEVHDKIVQGLSAAWLSLQLGDPDRALEAVETTTANAQEVVQELLADLASSTPVGPGDLVARSAPGAASPVPRERDR